MLRETGENMLVRACVVIPLYNHGGTIRDVVQRALLHCPHVLVVDDGSTDGGADNIADLPVTVIVQPSNGGKGKALWTAATYLLHERAEQAFTHMITLDADGQHYPEDLPRFFTAMEQNPQAIIIGNRDFSAPHIPGSSRFGRAFSGFWMWVQTGRKVSDMQSGYRAYPLAELLSLTTQESGYAFEVEVLVQAAWAKITIKGIEIAVLYPKAHERISHFHALRDNARMTWLNTKLTSKAVFRLLGQGLLWMKTRAGLLSRETKQSWSSRSLGSRAQHEIFRFMVRYKAFFLARLVLQVVVLYYTLVPAVRSRAMPYVEHRFGNHISSMQKNYHIWRLYRQFGEVLLCRMLHTESQKSALKSSEQFFYSHMQKVLAAGKGCLIVTAHVGGWQSGLAALEQCQCPIGVLLWRDPMDVDKHYFENATQSLVREINAAKPLEAMVQIHKTLKEGGLVLLMGDRFMDASALHGAESWVHVPFLGENIRLPIKAYALASKLQVPLLVQFTVQDGLCTRLWNSKEIVVPPRLNHHKPELFLPYALEYVQELERFVQENPYQFFNFHNIWLEK